MVEPERGQPLDGAPTARRRYVLYWMQASQRADFNPALEHAIDHANDLGLSVLVVCDRGYLRHQKRWRQRLAQLSPVRVEQVEGDVVVPVGVASQKQEYAARTIRPKIHRESGRFLRPLPPATPVRDSRRLRIASDFDPAKPLQTD